MEKRYFLYLCVGALLSVLGHSARAQAKPAKPVSNAAKAAPAGATEAALRDTVAQFENAWNRHDVKAWLALMTDDIWFTQTQDFYDRMKGKKAVKTTFEYDVVNTDLKWELKRVHMMEGGRAGVELRQVGLIPPKTDGKYKREDLSDPSYSRWRFEGGTWKLFFFTSHKGWALAEMKKDGLDP